jgi:hypothetical protein
MTAKSIKELFIWLGAYVLIALILLVFVAPDFTFHRREALYAYSHWVRNPSAQTEAEWKRQIQATYRIQYEMALTGSAVVCGLAYGALLSARAIRRRISPFTV